MRKRLFLLFLTVLLLCMTLSAPAFAEVTTENYTVTIPASLTMTASSQTAAVKVSGSVPMSSSVQVSIYSSSNFTMRNRISYNSTLKYSVYSNGSAMKSGDTILKANSLEVSESKTVLLYFQITGVPHTSGNYTDRITFRISTVSNPLTNIAVTTAPAKTLYNHGDTFDKTGMIVTAYYTDGSSQPVTGYTINDGINLPKGKTAVSISYTEAGVTKTATTPITVKNPLTGISVSTPPTKSTYVVGENFDPTGMVITATYLDGSTKAITDFSITDGNKLPVGKTSVSISYTEDGVTKTATTAITVKNPLTGISVTTPPNKAVYNHGDTFDKTGMVVTAAYTDGSSKTVSGYTISDGNNLQKGKSSITVSYTEDEVTKTATTPITVKNPLSSISVTTQPGKSSYTVGGNFDPTGMVITAAYLDGSTKEITDYTVKDGNSLPTGKMSVTISYVEDGVTKTVDLPISVINPLVSISVTTPPSKTVYNHGDTFDKTGMVVTASFKDGSSKTVADYTITDGSNMQKGKTSVTVSYTENEVTKTATTPVTVKNPLSSISVTTQPSKTSYTVGQSFDATGMVVTASYLDGSTKTVTNYSVTDGSNFPAGKSSVTVSYSEGGVTKTASVQINVANPLVSISVSTPPAKTAYIAGDTFDYTGMTVTAKYADGSTKTITNYSITDGSGLRNDQTSVTVSYTDGGVTKTATTPISVSNPMKSIAVTTNPNKTVYILGENFDPTGMVVTATYADGTAKTVTGYSISNGNNLASGTSSVTVSYSEGGITKNTAVAISVSNPLTGISVTTAPNKKSYTAGETFDYTGMVVTATYANGVSQTVSGYSITDGYSLSEGQNTVTISYTENGITKTATTPITVSNPLVSIAVTKAPNKTTYSPGETFNSAGMTVTATYANGFSQAVSGYSVTDGSNLALGKTSVTISYSEGGVTKTCTTSITVSKPVPQLAYSNTWYKGSVAKGNITSITIVDSYTPNGTESESWDASASNNGSVKGYRIGTNVILAGNGSGYIKANQNSKDAFSFFNSATPQYVSVSGGKSYFTMSESALTSITGLNILDTSDVVSAGNMFEYDSSLTSLNLTGFNTSKVTDMSYMFYGCVNLPTITFGSGWNTSNVQSMMYMFGNCIKITSLDVGNWNISNVREATVMFANCFALANLDVSRWNTQSFTGCNQMFSNCTALTTIDVSNWNVSKVTNMGAMFAYCDKLTNIDVSRWNTSSCKDFSQMFSSCSSLRSINVSSFNTSKATKMTSMFSYCSSLQSIDVSNFDTSMVDVGESYQPGLMSMFTQCTSLTSVNVRGLCRSNIKNISSMFYGCPFTTIDLSTWNTSGVNICAYMFYNCTNLTTIYASEKFNVSQVSPSNNGNGSSNSDYMFCYCSKLKSPQKSYEYSYAGWDNTYANCTNGYFTYKAG